MKNKLFITLPNGKELVAEYYNFDGEHPEISIYIAEDGMAAQDICLVRPHTNEDYIVEGNDIDCVVWCDECDEDYTHKFVIKQYEEEC
jgi:hypothetical protein